ncbi:hypothetical protein [Methylorubrum salsuginis]|uniref:Uncharacterized protein n=1 Tax=Methylorubrum salsuginis TaxID=414703 RepID=A0A1I4FIC7_9HYPH|nr:hypothetical protein [Methylorubrum salsuginis]SFL17684.1 hypothetical protein SAMN04488125_11059 [Methylorubrum salsuginis]
MQGKLSVRSARRHFSGVPRAYTRELAEPRTVATLRAVLAGRERSPDDVIQACRDIRLGLMSSRVVQLPGMIDCLGGLGLARLRGPRVTLQAAAHDLLDDADARRLW